VNQNLPPNEPGQSGDYSSGQAANPYYSEPPPGQTPDLDANAPQLKNVDSQKINTKALMFLGGIVLLLALLTIFVVMSGGEEEEQKEVVQPEQSVVTPLPPPTLEDPLAAEPPIPVDQLPPVPPPESLPPEPAPPPADSSAPPEGPRGPTLAERRMGSSESAEGGGQSVEDMLRAMDPNARPAAAVAERAEAERAKFLTSPDTLLLRGTYIRCVLETRIITDLPGFTSCIVTEPVYSVNGRSLLLPKGSKLTGSYSGGDQAGPRVAVVWDRVTTPTGMDATLSSPGVDNLGSSGHPGDYNGHWPSKISSALFISLLSDAFKYFGEKEGPQTQTVTSGGEVIVQPYQSTTAGTVERLANQAVAKAASRPATVTINQGTVVNIYVSKDVDFSSVITPRR
jgi:type IV secretion system protein VirB10